MSLHFILEQSYHLCNSCLTFSSLQIEALGIKEGGFLSRACC